MELFKIGWKDVVKGFILSIITSVVLGIGTTLNTGTLPTMDNFQTIGMTALAAGFAYLCKNFLTNSNDEFLKPELK